MGVLGFLGGFGAAASESRNASEQNKLQNALAMYKIKHELESDQLRRSYLLSRMNKPPSQGTGVKLSGPGGQEVWYPQTGAEVKTPKGENFITSAKSPSAPITKSFAEFLLSKSGPDGKALTWDSYATLPPPVRDSMRKEYMSALKPDEALKRQLMEAALVKAGFTNKMNPIIAEKAVDLMTAETKDAASGASTSSDVIPETPTLEFNPMTDD